MRQIIGLCCFIVEESGGHKTDMCLSATSLLGLVLQDVLAKSIRSLTGKRQCIVRSLSFSSGQNSQTEISVKNRKQTISVCLNSFDFNPIKFTKRHIEKMQVQRLRAKCLCPCLLFHSLASCRFLGRPCEDCGFVLMARNLALSVCTCI